MNNWYGWFIEQSFDSQEIFDKYPTVKMKSEEEDWKEHIVEIPEAEIDGAVNWLKDHLKPAWYAHLVRDNEIIIVYQGKAFRLHKNDSFAQAARYGKEQGIPVEQLPSDKLFDLARKSGF
jgi:hypothetical protein